jgi:hypothetical protein
MLIRISTKENEGYVKKETTDDWYGNYPTSNFQMQVPATTYYPTNHEQIMKILTEIRDLLKEINGKVKVKGK